MYKIYFNWIQCTEKKGEMFCVVKIGFAFIGKVHGLKIIGWNWFRFDLFLANLPSGSSRLWWLIGRLHLFCIRIKIFDCKSFLFQTEFDSHCLSFFFLFMEILMQSISSNILINVTKNKINSNCKQQKFVHRYQRFHVLNNK